MFRFSSVVRDSFRVRVRIRSDGLCLHIHAIGLLVVPLSVTRAFGAMREQHGSQI